MRDRVKEVRRVRGRDLVPNPANWRTHPPFQRDAFRGLLAEVGFVGAVVARECADGSLELLDGHLRAEECPDEEIPVLVVDLTDEEALLVLATFDPLAAQAQADQGKLMALLDAARTDQEDVLRLLEQTMERCLAGDGTTETLPSPQAVKRPGGGGDGFDTTPRESGPTRTNVGEIWSIGGGHRLAVGDCTDAEFVSRLMAGQQAEMVWTDPPYGVSIGDKNKFLNSIAPSNRIEENLQNDAIPEEELAALLDRAFGLAASVCRPGAAFYAAAPAGPLHLIFAQAMKNLGILRQMLIWVKDNATFSPMGVSYHWKHEPIFYGWLPNAGHRWHGDRKQTTIWEFDRPSASPDHPTMKPVELVAHAIGHSSLHSEIVYDPFLGSGTTLIASHRLSRVCYGCEIEPRYADVILRRAEAEGLTVTLDR